MLIFYFMVYFFTGVFSEIDLDFSFENLVLIFGKDNVWSTGGIWINMDKVLTKYPTNEAISEKDVEVTFDNYTTMKLYIDQFRSYKTKKVLHSKPKSSYIIEQWIDPTVIVLLISSEVFIPSLYLSVMFNFNLRYDWPINKLGVDLEQHYIELEEKQINVDVYFYTIIGVIENEVTIKKRKGHLIKSSICVSTCPKYYGLKCIKMKSFWNNLPRQMRCVVLEKYSCPTSDGILVINKEIWGQIVSCSRIYAVVITYDIDFSFIFENALKPSNNISTVSSTTSSRLILLMAFLITQVQ